MRYLSLFSGIEAVSVAWEPLGMTCVAVSEILPFQSSILAKQFPTIPNLGDVTKITADDLRQLGHIDIVVFGSPCQDMSIAGNRKGLHAIKEDENHSSILFYEGVRVFRLAQEVCGARFMLWENVPGALTSQEGRDFGTVLETLVGVKFSSDRFIWGTEGVVSGTSGLCEWAVLDAQWFGVPQRRRRVFAFVDSGNWRNRKPVLLEADNLRTVDKTLRKARKSCSVGIASCARSDGASVEEMNKDVAFSIQGNALNREHHNGPRGSGFNRELAFTLNATDQHAVAIGETVRRLTPVECERLQGFPDNWTNVGNPQPSKRYNALGRSMAVPVMRWIGERINEVSKL